MIDPTFVTALALAVEVLLLLILIRRVSARLERVERVVEPRPIVIGGQGQTIPRITFTGTGDLPLSIGVESIRWNGEPFPFATQGPILLEFSDENAVIATVRIPLAMVDHLGPILAPEGTTVPEEAHA